MTGEMDKEHNAAYGKIKELLKIPFSFAKKNGKHILRITESRGKELGLPMIFEAENPREICEALERRLR